MNEFIHVEPAHEQRPAFAAWGLSQTPPLQTASATGWDVPIDLYPSVPSELLVGGYVDGFRYDRAAKQPEPVTEVPAPVVDRLPQAEPKPARNPLAAERKPRKRAAKKTAAPRGGAYTRKPSELTVSADDTGAVIIPLDLSDGDGGQ